MYLTNIRVMISTESFNKATFEVEPERVLNVGKISMIDWLNLSYEEREDIIGTLYDMEVTFRALILGESPEDIATEEYTDEEDELEIPSPTLLRDFNDAENERNLKFFQE